MCALPTTSARSPILIAFGTRPEAIKLAPLANALRQRLGPAAVLTLCTSQHTDLIRDALSLFDRAPDILLDRPAQGRSLSESLGHALAGTTQVIQERQPALVITQGDTTTAFAGGLAAFYAGVPFVHLEAGIRTHDPGAPFPEEFHRVALAQMAKLHLAPTPTALQNLKAEGIATRDVVVIGNTGMDSLRKVLERLQRDGASSATPPAPYILATVHRRESADHIDAIANGLIQASNLAPIRLIGHPNPTVSGRLLDQIREVAPAGIELLPPQPYVETIALLRSARAVITDSGGIQEEAATIGVPTLVLREKTCRPEAVESGGARLVDRSPDEILNAVRDIWLDDRLYQSMAQPRQLYGDGFAAARAIDALQERFPSLFT